MKTKILLVCALAAPVVLPFATSPVQAQATAKAGPAGVAATVNNENLSLDDLNRMMESIKRSDPAFTANSPAAQKALAEIRSQILDQMINTKLLALEAQRLKIVPPVADVDKAVADVRSGFQNDADFDKWLKDDGKTAADLRKIVSDDLMIRELSNRLTADVTVSNDDIGKFYRENLPQFTAPQGVRASHILLALNPASPPEEKARVRKRATDLMASIGRGLSWDEAAKNNSDDPANKNNGGKLGVFTRGQMVKSFEDAAFSAPIGKVVGPIETDFGLHLIRVDEKIAERVVPITDVLKSPQIRALVLKEKVQAKLEASIAALKSAAKIQKFIG